MAPLAQGGTLSASFAGCAGRARFQGSDARADPGVRSKPAPLLGAVRRGARSEQLRGRIPRDLPFAVRVVSEDGVVVYDNTVVLSRDADLGQFSASVRRSRFTVLRDHRHPAASSASAPIPRSASSTSTPLAYPSAGRNATSALRRAAGYTGSQLRTLGCQAPLDNRIEVNRRGGVDRRPADPRGCARIPTSPAGPIPMVREGPHASKYPSRLRKP